MDDKSSAPRFSSFRPKISAPRSPRARPKPDGTDTNARGDATISYARDAVKEGKQTPRHRNDVGLSRRQRSPSSHRRKLRKKDSRQDPEKHKATAIQDGHTDKIALERVRTTHANEGYELYYTDRRGDREISRYRSLYSRAIPQYHRSGSGSVLGLDRGMKIGKTYSDTKSVVLDNSDSLPHKTRELLSSKTAKALAKPQRLLRSLEEPFRTNTPEPFLALRPNLKRQHVSEETHGTVVKEVAGILGSVQRSDHDSSFTSSDDTDSSDRPSDLEGTVALRNGSSTKRRNVELNAQTKARPQDHNVWLDLAEHQEAMMKLGEDSSRRLTASERRNLSDIKIDIYGRGLEHMNPANVEGRITLLLGQLREGSRVWETHKLTDRWQEAVKNNPNDITVASHFLEFEQTNFLRFRFDQVKSHFNKCLHLLSVQHIDQTSNQQHPDAYTNLHVLVRLTVMMREAGYLELAHAVWQALLEWAFFRPSLEHDKDMSRVLQSFEEFWESEAPRIGERDAIGWLNFNPQDSKEYNLADEPTCDDLSDHVEPGEGSAAKFYVTENEHERSSFLPARSASQRAEKDAYSVIMYSDISLYLTSVSMTSRMAILASFLQFLGFPGFPTVADWGLWSASQDVYITGQMTSLNPGSPFPLISSRMSVWNLFHGAFDHVDVNRVRFIKLTLQQLLSQDHNDTIAEYYLAFLVKFYPSEAAKAGKSLLKARRSNLRLYNAYALIESNLGNTEAALRVFSAALGLGGQVDGGALFDEILIRRTWAWVALSRRNVTELAKALQAARPGSKEALRLRIEQHFREPSHDHAVLAAECLALLQYLESEYDIHRALDVFSETSFLLISQGLKSSPIHELTLQAAAELIRYHITSAHAFRPSAIRAELTQGLRMFPNNNVLLSVYALNEARYRVHDRIRTLLDESSLMENSTSITRWLFTIQNELQRGELGGSTAHSVRATFERAIEVPEVRHNPCLWRSYVRFELQQVNTSSTTQNITRLKDVFFRGVAKLPWCKDFLMMAFAPEMQVALANDDRRKVWHVLQEKELRVFVDMTGVFATPKGLDLGEMVLPSDGESDVDDRIVKSCTADSSTSTAL